MNVLILSKSMHRGGIQTHILNLSVLLRSSGNRVYVASDILKEKERFKENKIPLCKINFTSHNPFTMFSNLKKLKRIIEDKKIDVVHCQWRICSVYMQILHKLGMTKVPFVWSDHVLLNYTKLKSRLTFYGSKAIVSSMDCYNSLKNDYHIPEDKLSLVYIGIDLEKYDHSDPGIVEMRERLGIKDEFIITMLCRFDPIKNHECMLKALNILVNEQGRNNIKCVIVGEANKEYGDRIRSLVKELKLEENVIFAGFTESISTLGITDLMVLPSQAEGFPISVIEAFAMKVPVIRTRTGGYSDVKDYCLDMDFDDYKGLAQKINYVMDNPDTVEQMCDKAQKFVIDTCTSKVMLDKLLDIYKHA